MCRVVNYSRTYVGVERINYIQIDNCSNYFVLLIQ